MANTSSRTLRLLSLLQTHRYWPGTELADRLDVSLRTLRRDIDRLRDLGYPVDAQRGVDGGYQLAPGAGLPPLVVDDEEAVALAVGLLAAAQSPVAGTVEASVRALGKVVQVMPKRLRRRVDALLATTEPATWGPPTARVDADTLIAVAQACRDSERLDFDYTAADQVRSERHVEPHRLVSLGRNWYLVAYDLGRHNWRSFRLDRLAAPRPTGARFVPRDLPARDAADFVRAGIAQAPRPVVVDAGRRSRNTPTRGLNLPPCRVRRHLWSSYRCGELQFVDLADEVGTEAVVRLLLDEAEPGSEVDASRSDQHVVGPQDHPLVARLECGVDAPADQLRAEPLATGARIGEQQAKLSGFFVLGAAEHAADASTFHHCDPRRLPARLGAGGVGGVLGDDASDERLEGGVPTELFEIELSVGHHHPSQITWLPQRPDRHPRAHRHPPY